MKALDLLAAGLEVHLQFKPIVVGRIRFGPIERDQAGSSAARHCSTLVARRTVTVPCSGATERRINGPAVQSARMLV
jgi:hypothetical protein